MISPELVPLYNTDAKKKLVTTLLQEIVKVCAFFLPDLIETVRSCQKLLFSDEVSRSIHM
jgi:hypothetical protein